MSDRPAESSSHLRGTLAGVAAIVLWCFSGPCYSAGTRQMGIMPFIAASSAVGVLAIVLLEALRGNAVGGLFRPPLRVAAAGFVGIVIYSLMFLSALGLADARELGAVLLLNYLWPIWIVLLSMVMLPWHGGVGRAVAGAILGFVGVAMSRGWGQIAHLPDNWIPHLLAGLGALLWALYSVLLRRWRIPAEQGGSTFQFLLLAIVAAGIATAGGQWRKPDGWLPVVAAIFGGIGPVGLGYYWWEIGIKRGSVRTLAGLAYFIPIGSATLTGILFRDAMTPWLIPGAALIALGAWMGGGRRGS